MTVFCAVKIFPKKAKNYNAENCKQELGIRVTIIEEDQNQNKNPRHSTSHIMFRKIAFIHIRVMAK